MRRSQRRVRRSVHPRRRGEHPFSESTQKPTPVHPRRRGEHITQSALRRYGRGSSPQARGTPAYTFFRGANSTVHPRRRGEHWTLTGITAADHGSSPQARGTHLPESSMCDASRFIPAGAGNTYQFMSSHFKKPVHPRRRGEHVNGNGKLRMQVGSSPQARGTPCLQIYRAAPARFIPAGAGNTHNRRRPARRLPVHPRRRGEHPGATSSMPENGGSSPQARGTQPLPFVEHAEIRFIPAGAGNTPTDDDKTLFVSVHPRRRGEHSKRDS